MSGKEVRGGNRKRKYSVSAKHCSRHYHTSTTTGEYIAIQIDDYMTYDAPPSFTIPLDNVSAMTAYEIAVALIDDLKEGMK